MNTYEVYSGNSVRIIKAASIQVGDDYVLFYDTERAVLAAVRQPTLVLDTKAKADEAED